MSAGSRPIERFAGEFAERTDPVTLARLLVDVATGGVGAVLAGLAALERAAGGVLPIDGARAAALFDLMAEKGRGVGCTRDTRGYCVCCDDVSSNLRRWLEVRLAPPCTLDQVLQVWDVDYGDRNVAHFLRDREGTDSAGVVARAYDALAGDDRAAFARELLIAPPPKRQRAQFEPGQPRAPDMPSILGLAPPPYPRRIAAMAVRACSAAEAVRVDARFWADPGWLAESRGAMARVASEPDTAWAEFDPAWPPDKNRKRAARVAAGASSSADEGQLGGATWRPSRAPAPRPRRPRPR